MEQLYWSDHLLFLLFGLIFPINSMFATQPKLAKIENWDSDMRRTLYVSNAVSLTVMAAIVLLAWYFAGRPLSGIGLQNPVPGSWFFGLSLTFGFLLIYLLNLWNELRNDAARTRAHAHWNKQTPFLPTTVKETGQFIPLAFSAGINEEIVFRGFFINYFMILFQDYPAQQTLALVLPSILFAVVHFYQGWKAVFKIGVLSLFFGLLYLSTESLLLPILLHILVDLIGGWISWRFHSKIND